MLPHSPIVGPLEDVVLLQLPAGRQPATLFRHGLYLVDQLLFVFEQCFACIGLDAVGLHNVGRESPALGVELEAMTELESAGGASSMPAIALCVTPPEFWRTRRSMSQYSRSTGRGSWPTSAVATPTSPEGPSGG